MTIVYVGLPILQHSRRFHLDKGRRWNVLEHLVLQALAKRASSAGELAEEGELPRRVILEILIRLMRAGWVELRAVSGSVVFHATGRGATVSGEDELPVVTERIARRVNFAVDVLTGSIFRRRDLTLLWPDEWHIRTMGHSSVEIAAPKDLPPDLGHVSTLLGALLDEDEHLARVDVSDRPPARRIALVVVRNGNVEGLPARAPTELRNIVLDAASHAPASGSPQGGTAIDLPTSLIRIVRPERSTIVRHEDYVLGGAAHQTLLETALRRARQHLVIHSTFLEIEKFERLLPAFRVAASRGCRIDILWGQASAEGGLVRSLQQAAVIQKQVQELGLSGSIEVHRFSTRSHAKLLVYDDGSGATHATVGSCNWLYSGFESFEASVRLRDPRLVADVLYELAELARPRDSELPELTVRLAQLARILGAKPAMSGSTRVKLLTGEEHDDCMLRARDEAKSQIMVMSHRLGVTAKPAVIIPAAAAVRERGIDVKLLYGRPSGPVKHPNAAAATWEFKEHGIDLVAVQRPRIHAKMLLWDDDNAVVTSLNWLSADATSSNPRGEIGLSISGSRCAAFLRGEIERSREFG